MPDSLVIFGEAVKAKADGKIGGYLVKFSDENDPDLDGDFFTSETDFGFTGTIKSAIYLNHRLPLKTANGNTVRVKEPIGEATLTKDDDGILVEEAILYNHKQYQKLIQYLGWSSGTATHLAETEASGKARKITRWPLGLDASLTPKPAQPQKTKAVALKSLTTETLPEDFELDDEPLPTGKPTGLAAKLAQHIDDLSDDKGRSRETIISQMAREAGIDVPSVEGYLANEARPTDARLKAFARVLNVDFGVLKAAAKHDHSLTIKGMFDDALAESTPSRWELESIYNKIIKRLANAASAATLAGVTFDLAAKVKEATDEYTTRLQTHALAQIKDWMDEGATDEFYLKSIIDTEASAQSLANADLDTHSQVTVSVLRELNARLRGNHEARVKAGRVLSEANRQRIVSLTAQARAVLADFDKLLEETQPKATEAEVLAAKSHTARLRTRFRNLGVNLNA